MNNPHVRRHGLLHHPATAWSILLLSFVVTGLAWLVSNGAMQQRAQDRFRFLAEDALTAIKKRMTEYELALSAGVGLFAASEKVDPEEWRAFAAHLRLQEYFPGIQGFGFTRMLAPAEKTAHERAMRAAGFPDYRIHPPGERDPYSAIVFLEPLDWRNKLAHGYDMFSEPVRRDAMERARDSGQAALSGMVTLMQETSKDVQQGVLMYLPVYRRGLPLDSVAERRAALLGFVYSPFRMRDLMHGILGDNQEAIDFEIYDGPRMAPDRLLVGSAPDEGRGGNEAADFEGIFRIDLAGHTWTLHLRTRDRFLTPHEQAQPLVIAAGGIVIDLLLFVILGSIARRHRLSEEYARRSFDLAEMERLRLARELHDEIGQSLAALNIALRPAHGDPAAAPRPDAVAQAREIVAHLVDSVREIAYRLRPAQLDDLGLAAALRELVELTARADGPRVRLAENLGARRLPEEIELCVFRIVQEAIANSLRHAGAEEIAIELTLQAHELKLMIADDGSGFDEDAGATGDPNQERRKPGGLGLIGMRERVAVLQGHLDIRSRPGAGTRILATLPLTEEPQ